MFFKECAERLAEHGFHGGSHLRISEFCFGLTFKLRVFHFYGNDRSRPLADVFAGEVVLFLFEKALLSRVAVQDAGQCRAETDKVRTAVRVPDVVRKGEHRFFKVVAVLNGNLDIHSIGLLVDIKDILVLGLLILVQVADIGTDPALKVKGIA